MQITRLSPVQTDLEDSSHFDEFQAHSSYIQGLRDNVGKRFTIVSLTDIGIIVSDSIGFNEVKQDFDWQCLN